ncbi:MAG: ABC transporter ATP-binding protein [Reichenbachiella sp.]
MTNTAIQVKGLSKRYKIGHQKSDSITGSVKKRIGSWFNNQRTQVEDFWALHGMSFEINKGDAVAIIGKNGAGKSTLLKILSRITHPTTGMIKMNGRVSSLLEVGTGFHPELTGRENVFLNGTILGMTRAEIKSKFDEIVAFSGVEKFLDTPVKHYSSGMYVRLAFAVAAHLEPEILIIDEVLAVGDAEFQKKCLGKMNEVAQQGRTVIFVSHNLGAVKSLCTRAIVLNEGKISFSGEVESALKMYNTRKQLDDHDTLANRKDREGSGKLKFVDVKMFNKDNVEVNAIISGEALRLELFYEIRDSVNISDLIVGLNFSDNFQNHILSFVSDETETVFKERKGKQIIELNIPSLFLRSETYFIRLMAFEKTTAMNNALDIIESASEIKVYADSSIKSARQSRTGYSAAAPCSFLINH